MKVNCYVTKRKKAINDQTKNEKLTIINAASENFVMHRRLILKIALKINDRENENFIVVVANEANETNEKEMNKIIVNDEAAKEKKEKINKTIIVNDEAINEKNVTIAKSEYLTKIFSTTLMIIVFNS